MILEESNKTLGTKIEFLEKHSIDAIIAKDSAEKQYVDAHNLNNNKRQGKEPVWKANEVQSIALADCILE